MFCDVLCRHTNVARVRPLSRTRLQFVLTITSPRLSTTLECCTKRGNVFSLCSRVCQRFFVAEATCPKQFFSMNWLSNAIQSSLRYNLRCPVTQSSVPCSITFIIVSQTLNNMAVVKTMLGRMDEVAKSSLTTVDLLLCYCLLRAFIVLFCVHSCLCACLHMVVCFSLTSGCRIVVCSFII